MTDKKEKDTKTELIKFRVSKENKKKLLETFGSFSAIRDYALKVAEGKGDDVKREDKK